MNAPYRFEWTQVVPGTKERFATGRPRTGTCWSDAPQQGHYYVVPDDEPGTVVIVWESPIGYPPLGIKSGDWVSIMIDDAIAELNRPAWGSPNWRNQ